MANKRTKHTGRDAHATCRRFRRKGHSTRTATHTPSSPDTPDPGPSSHAGARAHTQVPELTRRRAPQNRRPEGGPRTRPAPPKCWQGDPGETPSVHGAQVPFGTTCPPRQRTRASAPSCAGSGLSARRTRCPRAPLGSRGRAPISRARRPLQQVSRTPKRYCTPTSARWDVLHPSPAPRNRPVSLRVPVPPSGNGPGVSGCGSRGQTRNTSDPKGEAVLSCPPASKSPTPKGPTLPIPDSSFPSRPHSLESDQSLAHGARRTPSLPPHQRLKHEPQPPPPAS